MNPPMATDSELQSLRHIDDLTEVMSTALTAMDGSTFLDALDESQFTERRLEASREGSWLTWFMTVRGVADDLV